MKSHTSLPLLLLSVFFAICSHLPSVAQAKDYTSKVRNTATAWGGTGTYKAGDVSCAEYYSSDHFYHGTFSQTITGLPIGVYEAEVYFNASCAAWDCAEICSNGTKGRTHLFLNDAEVDVPIYNVKQITEPTLHTITGIHVSDGTLYLGARNDREGANWHLIRLKSLRYIGTDARSLYDAQFPLIRQARLALTESTCPSMQQLLQQALDESLVASAYDPVERLQTLYDNIRTAIEESKSFETRKASTLKNLVARLSSYQRSWNNGTREANSEQLQLLLPAVQQACLAKDDECDLDGMEQARQDLLNATNKCTAISSPVLSPTSAGSLYTLDGRRATEHFRGIVLDGQHKVLRSTTR